MVTNAKGGGVDRLLDELVAQHDAQIEGLTEELIERQVRVRVAEELQARAEIPRRSKMTPLEKSQYIRARGIENYNALPWD